MPPAGWRELTRYGQLQNWYPVTGLRVMYGFHPVDKELEDIRQATIQDIVFLQPPAIRLGVHTYGQPPSCLNLHIALEARKDTINYTSFHIGRRVREPQTFKLREGHDAWVGKGFIGRAILLSNNPAHIQIRHEGVPLKHEKWMPGQVLFFSGASIAADNHCLVFSMAVYQMEIIQTLGIIEYGEMGFNGSQTSRSAMYV